MSALERHLQFGTIVTERIATKSLARWPLLTHEFESDPGDQVVKGIRTSRCRISRKRGGEGWEKNFKYSRVGRSLALSPGPFWRR